MRPSVTRSIFLLLGYLLFCASIAIGQNETTVTLSGRVSGFGMDNVKLLKKLKKNISFEGPLGGVRVSVTGGDDAQALYTQVDGVFSFDVASGHSYRVSIGKKGYSTVQYTVDLTRHNPESRFTELKSIMALLGKDDDEKHFIGTFKVDSRGKVRFVPTPGDDNQIMEINKDFGEKSMSINNTLFRTANKKKATEEEVDSSDTKDTVFVPVKNNEAKSIVNQIDEILATQMWSESDVDNWKDLLDSSKVLLSSYTEGTLEYEVLRQKIRAMEDKLHYARKVIELQDSQIKSQRRVIWLISIMLILILLIAAMLFYFLRQKKTHVVQIEKKNREISLQNDRMNSSLEYASLIQRALLNKAGDLKEILPDSFIFYKPKVKVSGDFYWFTKRGKELVLVVADCTGHGVPGALLTMLGHSALDYIVNIEGITSPKKIMTRLDEEITKQLRDGNISKLNGMDVAIVNINEDSNSLTYCGAMSEIYVKRKGKLVRMRPNLWSIASGRVKEIVEETVPMEKGDSVFLYTDGYQDQFKGNTEEVETYNFKRFEQLMRQIADKNSFRDANYMLQAELDNWKQEYDQIDDILIVGVRL